jgi:hypothetical protein
MASAGQCPHHRYQYDSMDLDQCQYGAEEEATNLMMMMMVMEDDECACWGIM